MAATRELHEALDMMPVTESMVYIAGSNVPTVDGESLPTLKGDCVVSHRLGFLEGVKTFTIIGDYISLPSNQLVVASITPLLHKGSAGLPSLSRIGPWLWQD